MQAYAHKHSSPSWRATISVGMVEEKMAEGRDTEDWRRQLVSLQPINKPMAEPGTARLLPLSLLFTYRAMLLHGA